MNKFILSMLAVCCLAMPAAGAKKKTVKQQNPFLAPYTTQYGIPPFEEIKIEHYIPALEEGIKQHNEEINAIVVNRARPNFENTVLALDMSGEVFSKVNYVFMALNESDATPEMQALAEKLSPMITAHSDEVYMNLQLFNRIKDVHDNADALGLDKAQRRLTEKYYKRFVRNGALLSAAGQGTLKCMNTRLATRHLSFVNNVMSESGNNLVLVDNEARLSGLAKTTIDAAAKMAADKGMPGKWVFTASASTRLDVLTSADDRSLREEMYKTYLATASRGNEFDNSKNINEILKLRQRKAKLLGFDTFADYAVDPVMAKTVDAAEDLLLSIWKPAVKKVDEEVADMQKYADAHGANFKLEGWDYYYFAEKVKKEKYNFSEDEVRPYFKLENVVENGIFWVANKLYGLTFTKMPKAPKYNPEVTVYDVKDAQGKHVAVFMTDYFPRPVKAQGAWMMEMNQAYDFGGKSERPIIYNVGSFTAPTKDLPSLLTLDEVETVFHEFGHALNGMLTVAPYKGLEGTNIDRDIVEMPSQLNEHWLLVPEVLKNYAKHYKTGEVIPQNLVDKLIESSKFNQGFMTTELVGAALLDIEWHKIDWCGDIDVKGFEKYVSRKLGKPSIIEYRYRSPYFKHIFGSDEYACGYYTYLWAQVLEADGWNRFEEEGPLNVQTATDYKNYILAPGDTEDAMTLYKKFRGKEPNADALLRLRGLK
ncbi:MAG: M3 family metallopeptidase [Muribaculaceae bacterium]|nr:M3 family metallopeptidase [Muribaculaceae bacterium]